MKKPIISSILFCLILLPIQGQEINTAKIDSFLNHIEKYNQGIGSVAISKRGKTVYTRRFGQNNLNKKQNGEAFKYRIGSITKLMTATLVEQLVEQGRLSLTETLDTYFPNIPNAPKISLTQLLNHSSGLGNYILKNDSLYFWTTVPVTEQEIMNEIVRQGTLFEPGTNTKYSNSGYYLLARILEKKYNKKYPEILQEEILKPLGLKYTVSGIAEDATISLSYFQSTSHGWEVTNDLYFPNVIGVGDVASTPEELNYFTTALFTGKLLKPETVATMKPGKEQIFGLGVTKAPFYEKTLYGHGGDTFGTHSIALYHEEDSIAVAMSINGGAMPFNDVLIGVMNGIYDLPSRLPDFSQYGAYTADTDSLKQYTGIYKLPMNQLQIRIYTEKDNLIAQMTGQPAFCLVAFSKDVFKYSPSDATIEFNPTEKQLFLIQRGQTTPFTKE